MAYIICIIKFLFVNPSTIFFFDYSYNFLQTIHGLDNASKKIRVITNKVSLETLNYISLNDYL